MDVWQWTMLSIAAVLTLSMIATLLKGTLYQVGAAFRKLAIHGGEPWTAGAFAEPALSIPAIYLAAAVGIAHPDSVWARWFYGPERIDEARRRHGEPVGGDGRQ